MRKKRKRGNGKKRYVSEVGFEPTPTRVDCDLNAAP